MRGCTMKKIIIALLLIVLLALTACSSEEYRSVFDLADYSEFSSNKYGLSGSLDDKKPLKDKKVSLSGEVIEIDKPSYMDYLCLRIKDINKDEWLIEVTALDDDEQYSVEFDVGRIISVDGVFIGKNLWYDIPAIMMDRLYANNKYYYPDDFILKSGETITHEEITTESPTNESTTPPPFFDETYDLEGGSLTMKVGGEPDERLVTVDYQIDEGEIELSALLYMEIYIQTGSLAQKVKTLMFTVHDSQHGNSGYTTYLNGKVYMYEDPPFYGKKYDYSENGPFNKEKHLRISKTVDSAFEDLEDAIE